MNELILISLFIFVFSTYKLCQIMMMKEAPKGNKILAWTIYGASMLAIAAVNVVFFTWPG
ncbi:hypothetical protein [Virgibacillus sp. YIM 98842]|jgi:hypothetical protein|uniref:hypothetical protein n=1 Tax=Virgibacillus sp. YIM 98842 TaxID=2663533 RepID=UPI0013DBB9CE|nr:hypothetical protein [Virgibacillus sp. YIM 98842]